MLGLVSKPSVESHSWHERCDYWLTTSEPVPNRKRRERESRPLILTGQGLSLQVDRDCLVVRDGNTHFPTERREYRFFKGGLDLPPRIVLLDGSGNITLDALDWITQQGIPVIRLGYDGRIQAVSAAAGYSADPKKVAKQRRLRESEPDRVKFAIPLIAKKTRETLYNLNHILPDGPSRAKAIDTAEQALKELKQHPPASVAKLHAIEGRVAQGYFFSWRALEMTWKATTRYPIPDEWRAYFSRSSLKFASGRQQNLAATHPINAMLNYAYALLESSVRIQVIADGYDPSIGVMHDRVSPYRHSYVFDLMEPHRPVVDRAVLKLVSEETFSGADFLLQSDGVCRLNPELARRVASLSYRAI